jgi:hypothetical protein
MLTDIWVFLGTTGFMQIWICNYSSIACPLVDLMHKGVIFDWQEQHKEAMQGLKDTIVYSPALVSINYTSGWNVYLAVDSSTCGIGWILSQDCTDSKQHPTCFGLISWNEHESCYSQVKLKLYRLFCALWALCLHLVSVQHLIVEMDAQFICRMLNNPEIQPNMTINWWIAAILLFNFKLIHIPADKHKGPDGLSWHKPTDGKEDEDDNPEAWINHILSLSIWEATWSHAYPMQQCATWLLSVEDLGANKKATTTSHDPDDEGVAWLHQYLAMTCPPQLGWW